MVFNPTVPRVINGGVITTGVMPNTDKPIVGYSTDAIVSSSNPWEGLLVGTEAYRVNFDGINSEISFLIYVQGNNGSESNAYYRLFDMIIPQVAIDALIMTKHSSPMIGNKSNAIFTINPITTTLLISGWDDTVIISMWELME